MLNHYNVGHKLQRIQKAMEKLAKHTFHHRMEF